MTTIKLQDTSTIIGSRSRLEQYWQDKGFEKFYTKFRKGLALPKDVQTVDSVDKLINLYKLNSIGFGNWVTQEDRFNYISALTIAFYDIDKVIKFSKNIGLNKMISLSFGARGSGGALAHFEPHTFIINVTRYSDNTSHSKEKRFLFTGGAGSVAHEYGHALDYYFGLFKERNAEYGALTGGRTLKTKLYTHEAPLRKLMCLVMDSIIWSDAEQKNKSRYYQRLEKATDAEYYFRRNEIFARAFEKYIQVKLSKIGIKNMFLNDSKYDENLYLTDAETNKILPLFDRLIEAMSKKI